MFARLWLCVCCCAAFSLFLAGSLYVCVCVFMFSLSVRGSFQKRYIYNVYTQIDPNNYHLPISPFIIRSSSKTVVESVLYKQRTKMVLIFNLPNNEKNLFRKRHAFDKCVNARQSQRLARCRFSSIHKHNYFQTIYKTVNRFRQHFFFSVRVINKTVRKLLSNQFAGAHTRSTVQRKRTSEIERWKWMNSAWMNLNITKQLLKRSPFSSSSTFSATLLRNLKQILTKNQRQNR